MTVSFADFIRMIKATSFTSVAGFVLVAATATADPAIPWDAALAMAAELLFYWFLLPAWMLVGATGYFYYKTERAKLGQL